MRSLDGLSKQQLKKYNRLADHMQEFHEYFRGSFRQIYETADRAGGSAVAVRAFVDRAQSLNQHLTLHHSIEDTHIFPILRRRMPEVAQLDADHAEIHRGLDVYAAYLASVKKDPRMYDPQRLRETMMLFREVLHRHLVYEVAILKAESISKYYTLDEVNRLPCNQCTHTRSRIPSFSIGIQFMRWLASPVR